MKLTRRTLLIILLLGLVLPAGVLFRAFLLDNFVRPVALVLWLIWRVLLSIDQKIYWSLLIFTALFYIFIHLARRLAENQTTAPPPDSNLTLDTVDFWRTSIGLTSDENVRVNILKQNLGEMLASMYASRQNEASHWEVYEALQQGKIPLPEHIYSFLFPPKPLEGKRTFRQILQTIRQAPGRWVRQWTGSAAADYHRSIEEVLTFMESSMEIKHDD